MEEGEAQSGPPRSTAASAASAASAATGAPSAGDQLSGPRVDHRLLFEKAANAILIIDRDGCLLDANQSACELTGYTRDELQTKRTSDLSLPQEGEWTVERFDRPCCVGCTGRDRTLQRKDGSRIMVESHVIDLGNGMLQTTLHDVSKSNKDGALRPLDDYSTLVELCHAAVISAGENGRIASWNAAAEALFGYTATEAIGMQITKIIPPRLQDQHLAGFSKSMVSLRGDRFTRTLETNGLRQDDTEITVEVSLAVGLRKGELMYTAVIRDITERRAVLEKLNDAVQQLHFHINRMPLAYIVWDTEFRVVEWNPSAERIFGFTESEAIGQHAYDLLVPAEIVSVVDSIWNDLLQGDTSSHAINENVRKDKSRLTCEWFNTPLRDSGGTIRGVASMAMDVSEREALEAKIRDAQKLESLGVMASGIAHDFNSSLMVMLGNTALLRSIKKMPPRAFEHLELIEEAGARADVLIKHLLWYARTGRHKPQATALNDVLRDALPFVRTTIGKQHELSISMADGLPDIWADRSQIEQIILNLCLNARDAMRDGGTVTLETRFHELTVSEAARCVPPNAKPGPCVELVVADTGYGMDDSTVVRIFDPFFSTKDDGHGLGMAAVMGILRQHSAAAKIESARRQGTCIHIYLPVHKP